MEGEFKTLKGGDFVIKIGSTHYMLAQLMNQVDARLKALEAHANAEHTGAYRNAKTPNTRSATPFVNLFDTEQK